MTLDVEQFEYVKASETTALLRLSGSWAPGAPRECTLVATNGGTRLVLEPLPQPPADAWRAAYSAPLKRVESRRTRFRLETPGGAHLELPRPNVRNAGGAARPSAPAQRGLLERLRRSHDARAMTNEHRRALESNLAEARASEQAARAEMDELASRLRSQRERNAALETSLMRASAEADRLRATVRTLEDVLRRVRSHVADSQAQLTAVDEFAHTVRAAVEQTVYGGRDDATRARQRAHAIAELRRELDARMARLQHLEEQAQGLRAAIMARMDGGRQMDKLFTREREPQKV